jgi:hypothetical protein
MKWSEYMRALVANEAAMGQVLPDAVLATDGARRTAKK